MEYDKVDFGFFGCRLKGASNETSRFDICRQLYIYCNKYFKLNDLAHQNDVVY